MLKDYEETLKELDRKIKEADDDRLKAKTDEAKKIASDDWRKFMELKIELMESHGRLELDNQKVAEESKKNAAELEIKRAESEHAKKFARRQFVVGTLSQGGSLVLQGIISKKSLDIDKRGDMITSTSGKIIIPKLIGKLFDRK